MTPEPHASAVVCTPPQGTRAGGAEPGGWGVGVGWVGRVTGLSVAQHKLIEIKKQIWSNKLWFKCIYLSAKGNSQASWEFEANRRELEVINQVRTSAQLPEDLASGTSFLLCVCVCVSNVFIFEVSTLVLLKNGHSLYSWLPSILYLQSFQSRSFQHSLLAPIEFPPPPPPCPHLAPFPGWLVGGLGGGGVRMYSGNTSK